MEDIGRMLEKEYVETLRAVSKAETGSEEAQWQLKKLTELHRQLTTDTETRQKAQEAKEGKKDRIVKIVLDGAAIIVPVAVSSFWMAKGLRFEETGTYTSRTGKWISDHFRMFKK